MKNPFYSVLLLTTMCFCHFMLSGQAPDQQDLYVLSIGVNYEDPFFTTEDADDFAQSYVKITNTNTNAFKKIEIKKLTTKMETTQRNIRMAMADLERSDMKENDLLILFISALGKKGVTDEFLIMPSDYDPHFEDITAIYFKEHVLKSLGKIKANILILIDACHADNLIEGTRVLREPSASKMMNNLVRATSGFQIITASGDHDFSYEDKSWQNGAFTKAILEAFEDKKVKTEGGTIKADIFSIDPQTGDKTSGSDGVITVEELKIFLKQRVPFLVKTVKNKTQNPVANSPDPSMDQMGIFYVKN